MSLSGAVQERGAFVIASRKRRILAIYLDLVILGIPWALLTAFLRSTFSEAAVPGRMAALLSFTVAELVMLKVARFSFGHALLGMRLVESARDGSFGAVVDRDLKERESWLTLILGVLLLNSGAKAMVRWTQWHVPFPIFGMELGPEASGAFSLVLGAASCLVAFSLFRLARRAWSLGLAYLGVSLLFVVLSWGLWDAWAAQEVAARRAYQGMPVREGEVELMQSLVPEVFVLALLAYGVGLVLVRRRLGWNGRGGETASGLRGA